MAWRGLVSVTETDGASSNENVVSYVLRTHTHTHQSQSP